MNMENLYEGAHFIRNIPDERVIVVYRMLLGNWRLCIGPADSHMYDDFYCYSDEADVIEAAILWSGDGDPPGRWHRHGGSGRRREYDSTGQLTREYT